MYDRVTPNHEIITANKTGFSSFAMFSLAEAGRVTGDRRYIDAAMVFFREMRDKMRDGPFIGSGNYTRDFMARAPGGMFGGARPAGAPGTPVRPRPVRPQPGRPRQVRQGQRRLRRPLVGPRAAWRHVATASTSTCSRPCCRSTTSRNPKRSGTRSRNS